MTRLLVVLLAAVLAVPVAAQSPYGVNGTPRGIANAYAVARQAGLGRVRIFLTWSQLQPTSAPPDFDAPVLTAACGGWPAESAREIVAAARAEGLEVLANLFGTPCWAAGRDGGGACTNQVPTGTTFAAFAAAAATALGNDVAVWEIWNEPNFVAHWSGTEATYQSVLLAPAYDAIKAVLPDAKVAGPTLMTGDFYKPERTGNPSAWVLGAGGTPVRPLDVLTLHAYSTSVPVIRRSVASANDFASRNGIPAVWLTEFGWSPRGAAKASACPTAASEGVIASQAASVLGFIGDPRAPLLQAAFLYDLSDRIKPYCLEGCEYGLLDAAGNPRPRLTSLRTAVCALPGAGCD